MVTVCGGLNYLDASGNWRESQDLIELTPNGGAAALRCPNKVYFGPALDGTPEGCVKLITKSNLILNTCPIEVYYYDLDTGKEHLLAALTNSVTGTFQPPNRVLYQSAFHSQLLEADVRFTCTKAGLECDTIIKRQPKLPPQAFGMNPSRTLIQVRHAWYTAAAPRLIPKQISAELNDTSIDFGDILFAPGRAFAWDGTAGDTNTPAQIDLIPPASDNTQEPVGKTWQTGTNGNPSVLTESVLWADVQTKLSQLPLMAKVELPPASSAPPLQKLPPQTLPGKKSIRIASAADSSPGFVLDYITVSGNGNYTFQTYVAGGTNTYFLAGNNVFNGLVTFQPHCIIKEAPGCSLILDGSVSCQGNCSNPSILTSEDDNMYGEQIRQNCASIPAGGGPALWIWYSMPGSVAIGGMNIRYAQTGVEFDGSSCSQARTLTNSTIEFCNTAVYASDCSVNITNSIASSVTTLSSTASCGTVSGSWSPSCNEVSLEATVVSSMQALTNSHSPSTGIALYNLNTNGPVSYNTNCWIYGLKGYTSICASNGYATSGENALWYQSGCVLITSKHALTVDHLGWVSSNVLRFIGKSGTHYTALVTNVTTIRPYGSGDLKLLTLDRDLTNDVEPVRVLPFGAYNKMTLEITNTVLRNGCLSRYLPCIAIEQQKGAYADDLYNWYTSGLQADVTSSVWFPAWANGYEPWPGDSGHPIFVIINNELVLVGCWSFEDVIHGPTTFPGLGTNISNGYNSWFGFSFTTGTNVIVAETASRWNIITNNPHLNHQLSFFNSSGVNLASATVTANNIVSWSSGSLNSSGPSGWLTLSTNSTYYLLSQETNGGDTWYGWPSTWNYDTNYISIPGAAASVNLTTFVTYTNGASTNGSTYGPVDFSYFVYPHSGGANMPGNFTNAINTCMTTNGTPGKQYYVTNFDLSMFPNNLR
jgi:hypothetical protein